MKILLTILCIVLITGILSAQTFDEKNGTDITKNSKYLKDLKKLKDLKDPNSTKENTSNKDPDENEEDGTGKVWGYAFGDFFYKAGGDSTISLLDYTNYPKDYNSFDFRRIYLGYDHNISRYFFTRFVLAYDGNDVLPNLKNAVLIKDAFLAWKEIFTGSTLTIGLQPTPSYSFIEEKIWGYRSVEKTIMDQRGIAGSRDLGVMLNGNFDEKKNYGYYFMIATGSGVRKEVNKYKKYYGMLSGNFADKKITADIYADFENVNDNNDRYTFSSFLAYSVESFSIGLEGFFQRNKIFNSVTNNTDPMGLSLFATGNISENKFRFFSRIDYYNENTTTAQRGFNQYFVTAGIDFMPHKNVHLMPNIWLNAYSQKNSSAAGLKTDVVPRITFYYDYR